MNSKLDIRIWANNDRPAASTAAAAAAAAASATRDFILF